MAKIMPPLIIRADASTRMGVGHVMRCLALGQAWQDIGGRVIFAMAMASAAIETRLQSEGLEVASLLSIAGSTGDARETARLAKSQGAIWVVTDGYHFDADYQRLIKESGLRLMFIDDYGHADHYFADIILNQDYYFHEGLRFEQEAYTQLMLGTDYVMLRREFVKWQGWQRPFLPVARKILITLGGGDHENVTGKVLQALAQVESAGLEVALVIGPTNPHYQELASAAKDSRHCLRLVKDAYNMAELMAWADLVITGGGGTCWELAFMELPAIALLLSDNQRAGIQKLAEMGTLVNLGWHQDLSCPDITQSLVKLMADQKTRENLGRRGRELVDGKGADRVVQALIAH